MHAQEEQPNIRANAISFSRRFAVGTVGETMGRRRMKRITCIAMTALSCATSVTSAQRSRRWDMDGFS